MVEWRMLDAGCWMVDGGAADARWRHSGERVSYKKAGIQGFVKTADNTMYPGLHRDFRSSSRFSITHI